MKILKESYVDPKHMAEYGWTIEENLAKECYCFLIFIDYF